MTADGSADWRRGTAAGLLLVVLSFAAYVPAFLAGALIPKAGDQVLRYLVVCAVLAPATALMMYTGYRAAFRGAEPRLRTFRVQLPQRLWSSLALWVPIALGALVLGGVLTALLGLQDEATTAVNLEDDPAGQKLFFSFGAIVLAPWIEELSFRGLIFGSLFGRFGFWPAAVASSLTWSAIHFAPGVLVLFTLEGMALCWLRNRTGSVLPGVGIHGSWNTLASFANGGGVYAGICAALFAASLAAVVTRVREA